ncbi:glycosyltransferase [Lachnospiraceae bacterium 29-84]
MRKFLSVVIPRYRETEKDIFPLLSSISLQVGVDFDDIEVIIANDGDGAGRLEQGFLDLFWMEIRQVDLERNRGPGVARQAGLDMARGEYVIFCDADDVFHNVGVLGALMLEAEKNAPDMLGSSWLEEILEKDGKYRYITHEHDNTWMHGKLLRRCFLTENNICFHPELRVHEDSYMLCIAASLAERRRYLPITSYVWKYHSESITRREGAIYSYDSIPEFIRACSLAHTVMEQKVPGQMEYKILQFTLYNYFSFHQPGWQTPEHSGYLKDAEEAFVKYIKPMWHYWQAAAPLNIAMVYNEERTKNFTGCVESETVWEWIRRLGLPI